LEHGAKVGSRDRGGSDALTAAAYGGYRDAVRALIAGGADVNATDGSGRTALMAACRAGSMPVVQALLTAKADIQAQDSAGSTALTYAAVSLNAPIVAMLRKAGLRKGADVGILCARRNCGTEMEKLMMAAGASVKAAASDGTTATMRAAEANCIETLRFLLANGADPNAKTVDGNTALM